MNILSSLREELRRYFINFDSNEDDDIAIEVAELLLSCARPRSSEDANFCFAMTRVLVGLKDVIPTCVVVSAVAIPDTEGLSRCTFGLTLSEKREMDVKSANVVPNRGRGLFASLVNGTVGRLARRGDTIYYNLARAGRSGSYHLYVEGPEGTYYARGGLLRQDTRDRRRIYADEVDMQRRYGQRNAHIYIRSGHRMSNVTFMFRYRKTPLDTYHITFIATLLCSVVLFICAVTSTIGFAAQALSVPGMLLAVVTAAGTWIYSRASDGRDESWGIEVSTVIMTACSAVGMVLFYWCAANKDALDFAWAASVWSPILAVMFANAAMVGNAAMLHSSIYRYLLRKKADGGAERRKAPGRDRDVRTEVSEDGVRLDTPQGRSVRNPYALWTKAIVELKKECGIDV